MLIAEQPEGFDVALDILFMRFYSDRSAERKCEPALIEAGRELSGASLSGKAIIVTNTIWLTSQGLPYGPGSRSDCGEIAVRLRPAVAIHETSEFGNDEPAGSLAQHQPMAVLDALFAGEGGTTSGGSSCSKPRQPSVAIQRMRSPARHSSPGARKIAKRGTRLRPRSSRSRIPGSEWSPGVV